MSFWDDIKNIAGAVLDPFGIAGAAADTVGSWFGGDEEKKPKGDVEKLQDATEGWGTDEDAVMGVLKDKSPEETAALKKEYAAKTGGSLDATLKDELSGADLKKATSLMSGGGGGLKEVAGGGKKGGGIGDIVGGAAKGMISGAMGPVAGMMMGGGKKGGWFD